MENTNDDLRRFNRCAELINQKHVGEVHFSIERKIQEITEPDDHWLSLGPCDPDEQKILVTLGGRDGAKLFESEYHKAPNAEEKAFADVEAQIFKWAGVHE